MYFKMGARQVQITGNDIIKLVMQCIEDHNTETIELNSMKYEHLKLSTFHTTVHTNNAGNHQK